MKTNRLLITLVILGTLLLASCNTEARVGALRTESQSVELGDAESARVEIDFGAGDLELSGGADKLLEAGFNYNVARLKPEVAYTDGRLIVRQPEVGGMPSLIGIKDFRNQWDLRLSNQVPMDLSVDVGGGTSDLQLAGLSLTGLNITQGAGSSTVDLSGEWQRNLDVTIDVGGAHTTVRLPKDIGARVEVDAGASMVEAPGMTKDGAVYTNDAYGVSDVTLNVAMKGGIGIITLEVAEGAASTQN